MTTTLSPLDLLLSYQRRVLDVRGDIEVVQETREEWAGLAFRLGEQVLITPMSEVDEIVDTPACARVPNTKFWFLGVGNVRGNLIPITDLNGFIYQTITSIRSNSRVLTCSDGESIAGIVVDEILGLRRFFVDEQVDNPGELPGGLVHFVSHGFQRDDRVYPVFQLKRFVNSSEFLQIAS